METIANKNQQISYETARKKVRRMRGFYIHLLVYLVINIAIFVLDGISGDNWNTTGTLDNFSTAFFWGIGLLIHGFSVFGAGIFFSEKWEEKKIRQLIDKQEKPKWE